MADINKFRRTKKLEALLNWAETVLEFLDVFEGSFEDDDTANEAMHLQKRGLDLGLSKKGEAAECDQV